MSPPVRKYTLSNGLTILHQRNPVSKAFCAGLWTRTGSRDERNSEAGLCHFLEHMLFKGTARRSALQISQDIERVGGVLDAFTTKETMCVYAQVLDDHRDLALDIISDMWRGAAFPDDQVALEREVVLEEIGDALDAPDDLVHELFTAELFPDHALGRPIFGFPETVSEFSRNDLVRFSRRMFRASNIVLAVYGNIAPRELTRLGEEMFSFPKGSVKLNGGRLRRTAVTRKAVRKKLHQQHVCIGARNVSYHDEDRHAMMILSMLVGGGMSSRLFQRIREEMGLTYSIYTYTDHSRDTGMMATYMAVRPKNAGRAIAEVFKEYKGLTNGAVTRQQLEDTKEHIKGRILLGLETSTSRMMRLARGELQYGRQISERELIRDLDRVTLASLSAAAAKALDPDKLCVVSLGPSASGVNAV